MSWLRRAFSRRGTRAPDRDAALRQVLRLVLDDELDAAEEILSRLVREDSDQVDAYLALARLYRRRGETGRAIRLHQNLLLRPDLDPAARDQALTGLAGDFRQGGFLQRAVAAFEEVLARHPRDPVALAALVRLHADVREFDRAIELQRRLSRGKGLDGRAEEARLLVERAVAARAEGHEDEARKALRRAVRRDPGLARAWFELGSLEDARGRPKAAMAAWLRVPPLDRRLAEEVYPRLETTYAALGKARDYEAKLRGWLAERPTDGGARLALARLLAARGDFPAALCEIDALLELDADSVRAQAARARVLLAAADHEPAASAEQALTAGAPQEGASGAPRPREAGAHDEIAGALTGLLEVLERRGHLEAREPLA